MIRIIKISMMGIIIMMRMMIDFNDNHDDNNDDNNITLQHLQCSGTARVEPATCYDNDYDDNDDTDNDCSASLIMTLTITLQHLQCSGSARVEPAAGRQVCRRWKQQVRDC